MKLQIHRDDAEKIYDHLGVLILGRGGYPEPDWLDLEEGQLIEIILAICERLPKQEDLQQKKKDP